MGKSAGVSKTPTGKRKLSQMHREEDTEDEEMIMTPSKSSKTGPRKVGSNVRNAPSKTPNSVAKSQRQTAHIFKAEKPDQNEVIDLDDDESIYDGE
ncbi:hypothetical protein ABW20_dc0100295 [Dactylellina cionopaga]|nr:hypothetical protein ABW20_dc0100295 [Dactylellina cionopaga]